MKAKISIEFNEVSGKIVDSKMSKDRKFRRATEKTVRGLSEQIEKYFANFNIKVKTSFELE